MDTETKELVKQKINQLNPHYRDYVNSDDLSLLVKTITADLPISKDQCYAIEDGFLMHLIFIFSREEWLSFLVDDWGIPESEATTICSALVISLPPPIKQALKTTWSNLPAFVKSDLQTEIQETEFMLQNLPALRTMTSDSQQRTVMHNDEPTYTSTQAAILNESRTAPTNHQSPTNPPEPARWDSDR